MKISFKQNFPSGEDVILAAELSSPSALERTSANCFAMSTWILNAGNASPCCRAERRRQDDTLRILMEEQQPTSGHLKLGHNVAFGYYDQSGFCSMSPIRSWRNWKGSYRLYTDTEMRSILGRFLFRGDEVFLRVGGLSGGESKTLSA